MVSFGPASRAGPNEMKKLIDIKQYSDYIFRCHVFLMHYFEEKVFWETCFEEKVGYKTIGFNITVKLPRSLLFIFSLADITRRGPGPANDRENLRKICSSVFE